MGLFSDLGLTEVSKPAETTYPVPAVPPDEVFSDSEIPPDPNFDDPPPRTGNPDHACEVCGNDVQYKGRGRVPKRCPDCRSTRASSSEPRQPRMAGMDRRKAKVVENLTEISGILAGSVTFAAPVTGTTIALTSPPAIVSLVEIASKYPRMMDGLEKIAEAMPWVDIGRFAGGVAYAMAVDAGRIEPTGLVAEYLGVAEAAQRAGWQPVIEHEEVPMPDVGVTVASPTGFRMPDGA